MSIQSRKEVLFYTKKRYAVAKPKGKSKIIDEFVVTGQAYWPNKIESGQLY